MKRPLLFCPWGYTIPIKHEIDSFYFISCLIGYVQSFRPLEAKKRKKKRRKENRIRWPRAPISLPFHSLLVNFVFSLAFGWLFLLGSLCFFPRLLFHLRFTSIANELSVTKWKWNSSRGQPKSTDSLSWYFQLTNLNKGFNFNVQVENPLWLVSWK